MKINVKKISILALMTLFFISAILCCCFTKKVQAEEPTPSCHQTTHESEPSDSAKDCDCDQSLATVKEAKFLKDSLSQFATVSLDQLSAHSSTIFAKVDAYHSPPLVTDTSPLYIKHSILRI